MSEVRIGCSGWMYDDWRGRFYPERAAKRRWLGLYAERFDTVEVNATFYRLARRSAVEGWVAQTPPGFLFTVKASRYLTHVRRLVDIDVGIARFLEPLEPLRAAGRLGPILWQLPESFRRDDARLAGLLERLPPGQHTIEFRHASWFAPEVLEMLRERDVALALGDDARRPLPEPALATASFRFVRFHYGGRGPAGNYSATEIEAWAERITGWRRDGDVLAYFNNDWRAFAPANARLLRRRVCARSERAAVDG